MHPNRLDRAQLVETVLQLQYERRLLRWARDVLAAIGRPAPTPTVVMLQRRQAADLARRLTEEIPELGDADPPIGPHYRIVLGDILARTRTGQTAQLSAIAKITAAALALDEPTESNPGDR